jgi:hypothetical protein
VTVTDTSDAGSGLLLSIITTDEGASYLLRDGLDPGVAEEGAKAGGGVLEEHLHEPPRLQRLPVPQVPHPGV